MMGRINEGDAGTLLRTQWIGGSSPLWPTAGKKAVRPRPRAPRFRSIALMSLALSVGLGSWSPARAAEPMAFRIARIGDTNGTCGKSCAEVISAEGEITNDTADEFLSFLSSHVQEEALRPVVLLESPGGTVVGAMQLGMVFRKIGAAVIVAQAVGDPQSQQIHVAPGLCMSACVYAFFGGKKRVVPLVSKLGIHRMVINEDARDPGGGMMHSRTFGTDDIVTSLANYTKAMGIDPGVIAFAEQVAPETIHIVTPQQIVRWRLGAAHL